MENYKCNAKRGIGEVTIDEDVHFVTPTTTIKKRKRGGKGKKTCRSLAVD
jgi:hypothetical protein